LTTLFTISKSWQGDSVLLLEDAVLCIGSQVTLASFVAKCKSRKISVFALDEDARLRGIESCIIDIELVDYNEFVALVTRHSKQVAW